MQTKKGYTGNQTTRSVGNEGEDIAARYLESKGFFIITRNWRRKLGELDIVARKGRVTHFVEVKAVSVRSLEVPRVTGVAPEELAHAEKIKKVRRLGELYMAESRLVSECQVDVVAVYLDHQMRRARCVYYPQVL